jgi:DNA repair exonuclease SbcCD nuclease subunit
VRGATRKAFFNVVDLAIEQGAAFAVIAGDLYDDAWKNQSTGQFAIAQLARLTRAGIWSFIAFGNHDAESRGTRHLTAPEGVYKLKSAKCESVRFDDLGVVVHGRSYKKAATTENIASTYCPPVPGMLNVALLHAALDGMRGMPITRDVVSVSYRPPDTITGRWAMSMITRSGRITRTSSLPAIRKGVNFGRLAPKAR